MAKLIKINAGKYIRSNIIKDVEVFEPSVAGTWSVWYGVEGSNKTILYNRYDNRESAERAAAELVETVNGGV